MAPVYPIYQDTGPWGYWTTTSATTATVTQIWDHWTAPTGASSAQIWDQWAASAGPYTTPYKTSLYTPPSTEEVERRRKADDERVTKLKQAQERARKILVENLSDEQRAELEREGHFHIETRGGRRRYRLRPGSPPMRVHGEDGHRFSYCIHPLATYPADDVILALKLMIEANEDHFLSVANATPMAMVGR